MVTHSNQHQEPMTQEELISGLRSGIVLAGLDYLEPVLNRLEEQYGTLHDALERIKRTNSLIVAHGIARDVLREASNPASVPDGSK